MQDNASKAELESTKLKLEIEELRRPLLQRPAFYGVLGPTLLAACTLFLGFYTGLFDVKSEKLNVQTERLTIEKHKLDTDIAKLSAERLRVDGLLKDEQERSKSAIERAQLGAKEEIAKETEKLNAERRRLAEELEKEKIRLNAELDPLRKELASVRELIEAKNRELDELRVQSENRIASTLLDQLRSDDFQGPHHPANRALIELLTKDPKKAVLLDKTFQVETEPFFRANILYVLYQGTRDRGWLDKLFAFAGDATNAKIPRVWHVLGAGDWTLPVEIDVMKFIARTAFALNLGNEPVGNAFIKFHLPRNGPHEARRQFSTEEKTAIILLGRRLALDQKADPNHRMYGVLAAAYIVSEAYPVLVNVIALDQREPENVIDQIRGDIREIRESKWDRRQHLNEVLDRLKFPSNFVEGAKQWSTTAAAQKWKPLVLGNRLDELLKQQEAAAR
jgi:hypothetical protein